MKTIRCDCCRKKITDWTQDPHCKMELKMKRDGTSHEYDLCRKCVNGISMIVSGHLFYEEK